MIFQVLIKEAPDLTFDLLLEGIDIEKLFWPLRMLMQPFDYDRYTTLLMIINLCLHIDFVACNSRHREECIGRFEDIRQ